MGVCLMASPPPDLIKWGDQSATKGKTSKEGGNGRDYLLYQPGLVDIYSMQYLLWFYFFFQQNKIIINTEIKKNKKKQI